MARPWVVASAAVSVDGFLDDASPERLLLSNDADFDRVDELRASVDAILVGAGTIRADNPRLLVRSELRRKQRIDAGRPDSPIKVALSSTGLDPGARFFTEGSGEKLVYGGELQNVLADLHARGVRRLLVEGGGAVHTAFLAEGLVDELHLAVAPLLLGANGGRRFLDPVALNASLRLQDVTNLDGVAVLRYSVTYE